MNRTTDTIAPADMPGTSPTETAPVSAFIRHHFRHFNAATLVDAAEGWRAHLDADGRMMLTLAGAMSTAELGCSLAELIRQGKVHAITCTRANLEAGVVNLTARAELARPDPRGRAGAARPAHEPGHGHVHPRSRGDAAHRGGRARGVDRGGPARRASVPARVHVSNPALGQAGGQLPDRPARQL